MTRRITIVTAGGLLFLALGPRTSSPPSALRAIAARLSETRLHALELENGCLDDQDEPVSTSPPDWDTATIAGGDVPPARVVSDPYPTFHSVAVDAEHDRV